MEPIASLVCAALSTEQDVEDYEGSNLNIQENPPLKALLHVQPLKFMV